MIPFSIVKFLSGFNPFNPQALGKVLWVIIWIAVALTIYTKTFIEPKYKYITDNKQTIQSAKEVHNHYEQITVKNEDKFSLLKIGGLKLLSYE